MTRPAVQTIATAVPSVAPPPLVVHIVERVRDPARVLGPYKPHEFHERTLCGEPWDRPGVVDGPRCDGCVAEFRRRHPGKRVP